jgi:hypothetical protein
LAGAKAPQPDAWTLLSIQVSLDKLSRVRGKDPYIEDRGSLEDVMTIRSALSESGYWHAFPKMTDFDPTFTKGLSVAP